MHTREEFDDKYDGNALIDSSVLLKLDSETNEITILDYGVFRPSQILYALDRQAYKMALQAAVDNPVNDEEAEQTREVG